MPRLGRYMAVATPRSSREVARPPRCILRRQGSNSRSARERKIVSLIEQVPRARKNRSSDVILEPAPGEIAVSARVAPNLKTDKQRLYRENISCSAITIGGNRSWYRWPQVRQFDQFFEAIMRRNY